MYFAGTEYKEFYSIEELRNWEICKLKETYAPLMGTLLASYSCLRIIQRRKNEILCKLESQFPVTIEIDRTIKSYLFNR